MQNPDSKIAAGIYAVEWLAHDDTVAGGTRTHSMCACTCTKPTYRQTFKYRVRFSTGQQHKSTDYIPDVVRQTQSQRDLHGPGRWVREHKSCTGRPETAVNHAI